MVGSVLVWCVLLPNASIIPCHSASAPRDVLTRVQPKLPFLPPNFSWINPTTARDNTIYAHKTKPKSSVFASLNT
jgi:hypothetical protein